MKLTTFEQKFLMKHRIMQVQYTPCTPDLTRCNSFFSFAENLHQGYQKIKKCRKVPYQKMNFKGASANGKLTGISVLNARVMILKKINISLVCLI